MNYLQSNTLALKTFAVVAGLVVAVSVAFASAVPAQAFWFPFPWGYKAYAQESVTVTITKYLDGEKATAEDAESATFPMTASWDDPEGIGSGSGDYELSASGGYTAETADMMDGASYSTHERTDGSVVGASCDSGKPYALVGYTTGSTMASAEAATPTDTAPDFSNLEEDKYVIVWNETCDNDGTPSGDLEGQVTGGQDAEPGELEVTSIDMVDTTAVANGEFDDGWAYVFHITVPTNEPNLSMKFANWMSEVGGHTIPVAGNMRISSDQADDTNPVTLSAADTYSSPALTMTTDLDAAVDGIQVEVLVETAVPVDTFNGTYSTSYGVQTLP